MTTDQKVKEIQEFCKRNADPAIVAKYAKYFKEGYDGYGVDDKIFQMQRDEWLKKWHDDMTIDDYLDLGDELVTSGKFEEIAYAIHFLAAQREHYSTEVMNRIGHWFELGIANWGSTDVLCMLVLLHFLNDKIIGSEKLQEWSTSTSQWQRRAVPVTFVHVVKTGFEPNFIWPVIEPLMLDESEYVQKGLGTLLRELWKKNPAQTEDYLLRWKDECGRLIIRYATEKMDKERRKQFRRAKKKKT